MRGEHWEKSSRVALTSGSSPHARGTLVAQRAAALALGIIPACAGNTAESSPTGIVTRDHPRMRGEHSKKIA